MLVEVKVQARVQIFVPAQLKAKRATGKVSFLFSRSFLLVLAKLSFWQEDWALGYHSLNFRLFPNIS